MRSPVSVRSSPGPLEAFRHGPFARRAARDQHDPLAVVALDLEDDAVGGVVDGTNPALGKDDPAAVAGAVRTQHGKKHALIAAR